MSEDSYMTYSSWVSKPDSDITEILTPEIQDVNEEIQKVCQYYVGGENLMKATSPALSQDSFITYSS